ncbi:hypothetical protein JTE90_009914 [Oedothorax gibbosus]|uniref:Microtubule-associated protein futsch n=1 Tax=Oedothorax gibbosus TaxID=931172 RepID=A0AAV6UU74_9ARAC|nr:hypothetical protein JTE90_009914 [Oedothorax gibbosus]
MATAPPGCYLLLVLGQPCAKEHKEQILKKVEEGLLSWDVEETKCDLLGLESVCSSIQESNEVENELLIQHSTENLAVEVLLNPHVNTLKQCLKNLLAANVGHKHIIHAGYTFSSSGSWVLQDGSFSYNDFIDTLQDADVQRALRRHLGSTVHVHCIPEGPWDQQEDEGALSKTYESLYVNPASKVSVVPGSSLLLNCLDFVLRFQPLTEMMKSSPVVGNIRFNRPTLYVFPGGQGDCALFGVSGFTMLIDGGFNRKPCFWEFIRHLDRLDAIMITRLNENNVCGITNVVRRKQAGQRVYPQVGYVFCNVAEGKQSPTSPGTSEQEKDPLLVSVIQEGREFSENLQQLGLKPHRCLRDCQVEPLTLFHKVGHGTLEMYVLSPPKDSKEMKMFFQQWTSYKEHFSSRKYVDDREVPIPLSHAMSICALLIWKPANPTDTITRVLLPGSAPQSKIFEGLEHLQHLEELRYRTCSQTSLGIKYEERVKIKTTRKHVTKSLIAKQRAEMPRPSSPMKSVRDMERKRDQSPIKLQTSSPVRRIKKSTKKVEDKKVYENKDLSVKKSSKTVLKKVKKRIRSKSKEKSADEEKQDSKESENKNIEAENVIQVEIEPSSVSEGEKVGEVAEEKEEVAEVLEKSVESIDNIASDKGDGIEVEEEKGVSKEKENEEIGNVIPEEEKLLLETEEHEKLSPTEEHEKLSPTEEHEKLSPSSPKDEQLSSGEKKEDKGLEKSSEIHTDLKDKELPVDELKPTEEEPKDDELNKITAFKISKDNSSEHLSVKDEVTIQPDGEDKKKTSKYQKEILKSQLKPKGTVKKINTVSKTISSTKPIVTSSKASISSNKLIKSQKEMDQKLISKKDTALEKESKAKPTVKIAKPKLKAAINVQIPPESHYRTPTPPSKLSTKPKEPTSKQSPIIKEVKSSKIVKTQPKVESKPVKVETKTEVKSKVAKDVVNKRVAESKNLAKQLELKKTALPATLPKSPTKKTKLDLPLMSPKKKVKAPQTVALARKPKPSKDKPKPVKRPEKTKEAIPSASEESATSGEKGPPTLPGELTPSQIPSPSEKSVEVVVVEDVQSSPKEVQSVDEIAEEKSEKIPSEEPTSPEELQQDENLPIVSEPQDDEKSDIVNEPKADERSMIVTEPQDVDTLIKEKDVKDQIFDEQMVVKEIEAVQAAMDELIEGIEESKAKTVSYTKDSQQYRPQSLTKDKGEIVVLTKEKSKERKYSTEKEYTEEYIISPEKIKTAQTDSIWLELKEKLQPSIQQEISLIVQSIKTEGVIIKNYEIIIYEIIYEILIQNKMPLTLEFVKKYITENKKEIAEAVCIKYIVTTAEADEEKVEKEEGRELICSDDSLEPIHKSLTPYQGIQEYGKSDKKETVSEKVLVDEIVHIIQKEPSVKEVVETDTSKQELEAIKSPEHKIEKESLKETVEQLTSTSSKDISSEAEEEIAETDESEVESIEEQFKTTSDKDNDEKELIEAKINVTEKTNIEESNAMKQSDTDAIQKQSNLMSPQSMADAGSEIKPEVETISEEETIAKISIEEETLLQTELIEPTKDEETRNAWVKLRESIKSSVHHEFIFIVEYIKNAGVVLDDYEIIYEIILEILQLKRISFTRECVIAYIIKNKTEISNFICEKYSTLGQHEDRSTLVEKEQKVDTQEFQEENVITKTNEPVTETGDKLLHSESGKEFIDEPSLNIVDIEDQLVEAVWESKVQEKVNIMEFATPELKNIINEIAKTLQDKNEMIENLVEIIFETLGEEIVSKKFTLSSEEIIKYVLKHKVEITCIVQSKITGQMTTEAPFDKTKTTTDEIERVVTPTSPSDKNEKKQKTDDIQRELKIEKPKQLSVKALADKVGKSFTEAERVLPMKDTFIDNTSNEGGSETKSVFQKIKFFETSAQKLKTPSPSEENKKQKGESRETTFIKKTPTSPISPKEKHENKSAIDKMDTKELCAVSKKHKIDFLSSKKDVKTFEEISSQTSTETHRFKQINVKDKLCSEKDPTADLILSEDEKDPDLAIERETPSPIDDSDSEKSHSDKEQILSPVKQVDKNRESSLETGKVIGETKLIAGKKSLEYEVIKEHSDSVKAASMEDDSTKQKSKERDNEEFKTTDKVNAKEIKSMTETSTELFISENDLDVLKNECCTEISRQLPNIEELFSEFQREFSYNDLVKVLYETVSYELRRNNLTITVETVIKYIIEHSTEVIRIIKTKYFKEQSSGKIQTEAINVLTQREQVYKQSSELFIHDTTTAKTLDPCDLYAESYDDEGISPIAESVMGEDMEVPDQDIDDLNQNIEQQIEEIPNIEAKKYVEISTHKIVYEKPEAEQVFRHIFAESVVEEEVEILEDPDSAVPEHLDALDEDKFEKDLDDPDVLRKKFMYIEVEVEESVTATSDASPDTDAPEIPYDGRYKEHIAESESTEIITKEYISDEEFKEEIIITGHSQKETSDNKSIKTVTSEIKPGPREVTKETKIEDSELNRDEYITTTTTNAKTFTSEFRGSEDSPKEKSEEKTMKTVTSSEIKSQPQSVTEQTSHEDTELRSGEYSTTTITKTSETVTSEDLQKETSEDKCIKTVTVSEVKSEPHEKALDSKLEDSELSENEHITSTTTITQTFISETGESEDSLKEKSEDKTIKTVTSSEIKSLPQSVTEQTSHEDTELRSGEYTTTTVTKTLLSETGTSEDLQKELGEDKCIKTVTVSEVKSEPHEIAGDSSLGDSELTENEYITTTTTTITRTFISETGDSEDSLKEKISEVKSEPHEIAGDSSLGDSELTENEYITTTTTTITRTFISETSDSEDSLKEKITEVESAPHEIAGDSSLGDSELTENEYITTTTTTITRTFISETGDSEDSLKEKISEVKSEPLEIAGDSRLGDSELSENEYVTTTTTITRTFISETGDSENTLKEKSEDKTMKTVTASEIKSLPKSVTEQTSHEDTELRSGEYKTTTITKTLLSETGTSEDLQKETSEDKCIKTVTVSEVKSEPHEKAFDSRLEDSELNENEYITTTTTITRTFISETGVSEDSLKEKSEDKTIKTVTSSEIKSQPQSATEQTSHEETESRSGEYTTTTVTKTFLSETGTSEDLQEETSEDKCIKTVTVSEVKSEPHEIAGDSSLGNSELTENEYVTSTTTITRTFISETGVSEDSQKEKSEGKTMKTVSSSEIKSQPQSVTEKESHEDTELRSGEYTTTTVTKTLLSENGTSEDLQNETSEDKCFKTVTVSEVKSEPHVLPKEASLGDSELIKNEYITTTTTITKTFYSETGESDDSPKETCEDKSTKIVTTSDITSDPHIVTEEARLNIKLSDDDFITTTITKTSLSETKKSEDSQKEKDMERSIKSSSGSEIKLGSQTESTDEGEGKIKFDSEEESNTESPSKRRRKIIKKKVFIYHTGSETVPEDMLNEGQIKEAIIKAGGKPTNTSHTRIISSGITDDLESFAGQNNAIEIFESQTSEIASENIITTESTSEINREELHLAEFDPFSLITKPIEETFRRKMLEERLAEHSSESKKEKSIESTTFCKESHQDIDKKVATDAKKLAMETTQTTHERRETQASTQLETSEVVNRSSSTTSSSIERSLIQEQQPTESSIQSISRDSAEAKSFSLDEWDKPMGLPSPPMPLDLEGDLSTLTKQSTTRSSKDSNYQEYKADSSGNGQDNTVEREPDFEKSNKETDSLPETDCEYQSKNKSIESSSDPVYIDLTYVPHFGDPHYCNVEFFRRIRSRYYVFSGTKPSKEVFNALLEAKKDWKDKDAKVTIIPTYETDTLGYWMAVNQEALIANNIDVAPSASRCTINLQDHETSCSAYRLEL